MYIHAYVKFLLVKVYIAICVCTVKISALCVLFNFSYIVACMYDVSHILLLLYQITCKAQAHPQQLATFLCCLVM